jgi:hypothetical protein
LEIKMRGREEELECTIDGSMICKKCLVCGEIVGEVTVTEVFLEGDIRESHHTTPRTFPWLAYISAIGG